MSTTYEELVTLLSNGLSHRALYFREHPRVRASAQGFAVDLARLLEASGKEAFFLGVAESRLVHEGRFLLGSTLLGRRLIDFAQRLRCGGFLFRKSLAEREVSELFGLYAEIKEPVQSLEEARGLFVQRGVRAIELSPPYEDAGWFGQFLFSGSETSGSEMVDDPALEPMIPVYQSLFESVEVAHSNGASDRALDIDGARSATEKLLSASGGDFKDILQLVRYPDYDTYTVGHSVRVALLAVIVGTELGLAPELLIELGTAGLLHDVGKSKIPQEILYKPARLDEEERRVMSRHPSLGAQILIENEGASPLSIGAAWGHHVRRDRAGYPRLSPWAGTSRATALVQVCDVYEALTAVRPYKPALAPRRAYEIMLRDRDAFEPAALAALISALGLYPPGSHVRLSSGETALVCASGADPERPRVRIGDSLVDLSAEEGANLTVRELILESSADGRRGTGGSAPIHC